MTPLITYDGIVKSVEIKENIRGEPNSYRLRFALEDEDCFLVYEASLWPDEVIAMADCLPCHFDVIAPWLNYSRSATIEGPSNHAAFSRLATEWKL